MESRIYRIGEVARRTGVTVRTLHYWDQIGLLSPEQRTTSGHRLYGRTEIRRLQKIMSLRSIGLSLDDIASVLERDSPPLGEVLRAHRDRVGDQIQVLEELARRLDRVLALLSRDGEITDDQLMETMEVTNMIEKHFSKEQLRKLEKRRRELGSEAIRAAAAEWPELISRLKSEMENGSDPKSPAVQAIARRWSELIEAFSGGDKGIEQSLGSMYREHPAMAERQGLSTELFRFLDQARNAGA